MPDYDTSLVTFAELDLGFNLYPWQVDVIRPFNRVFDGVTKVSLATPNESGKSSYVIPSVVLGILNLYPRASIVLLTAAGRQLDSQVMPALEAHRAKFPTWKFIEREIQTPGPGGIIGNGGRFVAMTTDDAGRAEGFHKFADATQLTGPLVIIVDEAKSVHEKLYAAIDRCGYSALMLTSSPGGMSGRFYESQTRAELGFLRFRVGLADCPHIGQEKIDRLEAQYGENGVTPNPEFLRSVLHGEFMAAGGEGRFNRAGLDILAAQCLHGHQQAHRGTLEEQLRGDGSRPLTWLEDREFGWVWMSEEPRPGCYYIGFCDPATGAQSEGSLKRDMCAAGIIRAPYVDLEGIEHDAEVVAVLHHPSPDPAQQGVRWDNDIVAERFSRLLRFYGDCIAIIEANNAGVEVIGYLNRMGRNLWRREKPDHRQPGKKMETVGYLTGAANKANYVGALVRCIREQVLVCKYAPAVKHFQTFILDEAGKGNAQAGEHDDFVTGVGLGLLAINAATPMPVPVAYRMQHPQFAGVPGPWS